jgi:hypothetical protein
MLCGNCISLQWFAFNEVQGEKTFPAFILTLLVSSLFIVSTVNGVTVSSAINSDTTWTKPNSPYTITGTVTVQNGVTLTIEPGVTVNVGQGAVLQVEGTLVARGTNTDNVVLNGGEILLMPSSSSWNQQTSSGTIIENTQLNYVMLTVFNSAKINNNTICGRTQLYGGSPQITYNTIVGYIESNASLLSPVISYNNIVGQIFIGGGSPTISQNYIKGMSHPGNTPSSGIAFTATYEPNRLFDAVITDNTIVDALDGISSLAEGGTIANNLIVNCSRFALSLGTMPETSLYARVENNTIVNSAVAIKLFNYVNSSPPPTIKQNNIVNSSQYSVYSCGMNISAAYNWWGTTDTSAIEQTIHDRTFDPYAGEVTISPILTAPNLFAYPTADRALLATAQEILFTANGTTGTTGYVKATISKAFMPEGDIKVYLDGNPVNYTQTSNEESWIITFIYHHSIHQVRINEVLNPALTTLTEDKYLIFITAGVIAALLGFLGLIIWLTQKKH